MCSRKREVAADLYIISCIFAITWFCEQKPIFAYNWLKRSETGETFTAICLN